jgi:hypothetical protein
MWSATQKREIASAIKDISLELAETDFQHLQNLLSDKSKQKTSKAGTTTVDFFTFTERLHTVGNKGMSFFDFLEQLPTLKKKKYVQNMIAYYHTHHPTIPPMKMWYRIFSMYFGSINVFRPAMSMFLYTLPGAPPPSQLHILDPTMGWGGRLLGAVATQVASYTGIDINHKLKPCYTKMVAFLKKQSSTTDIRLHFTDAVHFSYRTLPSYNMVLTSPPYFDIETYSGMKQYGSKEKWKDEFYRPLFCETMKYLSPGGLYILNVPVDIYETVCVPLWGATRRKYPLKLASRANQSYQEFVYVWTK